MSATPPSDTLYVANARDGSVRLFHGVDDAPDGRIDLGDDADNVRFDAAADDILVGYGDGAIAFIDAALQRKVGDVALPAHPESFQIASVLNKVFVNVPGAHALAVLNGLSGRQMRWPIHDNRVARVPTVARARTSLFVPELDRLFVAVRANVATEAAIWVFRPVP